jgi:hypothetical protein
MTTFLDARVKLRIGTADTAGPEDALLIEGAAAPVTGIAHARFKLPEKGTHSAGCACCVPRGPVAEALTRLFLQRVRGEVAYFSAVVAAPASAKGEAAIRAALKADPLVAARYRLDE